MIAYGIIDSSLKTAVNDIESNNSTLIINGLKDAVLSSEKNFKQLFNSSHFPQWIYDSKSLHLLIVNETAILQYGYSEQEFLNMTIFEIAPSEDVQKLILFNEFMKSNIGPFSVVNFHLKKNKESILVETTFANIKYRDQPSVLVTSRSISEKIKTEEKISLLKASRQQKITLAAINGQEKERDNIGKELNENINQLLSAARIYLGLSKASSGSGADFIEQADKILLKAIRETRSLSSSLIPAALHEFGLKASLHELFRNYLDNHSFIIDLSFDEDLENIDREVKISLFRIIQEQLNNILNHALAHNISISLSIGECIVLLIKDDGVGFDTSAERQGMGISNIMNRVESYNGTVQVQSESQKGCTLLVNIPNPLKMGAKGKIKVLIVEDDLDDQEIIARAFAEVASDHTLTFLDDGKKLVDLLQSFPDPELPSLIILDYNMPLLNGLETLRILELDPRFNQIPKIIYSSSSQNHIKNLCYSANAKAYITKGTTLMKIKENIQEMLSFVRSV